MCRYQYLRDFDKAMQLLDEKFRFMSQGPGHVSRKNEGDKVMVFERGGLLWIFNFHPTKVCVDVPYLIVLTT
jgi:1,4-alpha-glucan branching enzyme